MARNALVIVIAVAAVMCAVPSAAEGPKRVKVKPALLVIDVQNLWLPMMAEEDRSSAPEKINAAIKLFRELELPIIRVYHSDPENGPQQGSADFQFAEAIAVADTDLQVIKDRASAFVKTDLERLLKEHDRDAVFLCGLSATGCVLATYFGALERDFTPVMVKEALLSGDAKYTRMIEDICLSMSVDDIRSAFAGTGASAENPEQ